MKLKFQAPHHAGATVSMLSFIEIKYHTKVGSCCTSVLPHIHHHHQHIPARAIPIPELKAKFSGHMVGLPLPHCLVFATTFGFTGAYKLRLCDETLSAYFLLWKHQFLWSWLHHRNNASPVSVLHQLRHEFRVIGNSDTIAKRAGDRDRYWRYL